jgi:HAD superfamily hydrolase (TIGR01459 family)
MKNTEIIKQYNAFLVDIWGTIHSGGVLYTNAKTTLKEMMASGYVILFSNAPRPILKVEQFLAGLGVFKGEHYHEILTSGQAFIYYAMENKLKNVFYIGPDKDLDVLNNTNIDVTQNINSEFDEAIVTGITNLENIGQDVQTLERLLEKKRRLLCLNPDIVVTTKNGMEHCAGELARIYAEMGGKVVYFGKPYKEVYSIALSIIKNKVQNPKIVAIGDVMETDILGANLAGIDSIFLKNGVGRERIAKYGLESFLFEFECKPTYIIEEL